MLPAPAVLPAPAAPELSEADCEPPPPWPAAASTPPTAAPPIRATIAIVLPLPFFTGSTFVCPKDAFAASPFHAVVARIRNWPAALFGRSPCAAAIPRESV